MGKPRFKYMRKQLLDGEGEITRFESGELHVHLSLTGADLVKSCPFCGSLQLTLSNTHSAYYAIACNECGAELHGESFGENVQNASVTLERHREAKASTIAAWNRRS